MNLHTDTRSRVCWRMSQPIPYTDLIFVDYRHVFGRKRRSRWAKRVNLFRSGPFITRAPASLPVGYYHSAKMNPMRCCVRREFYYRHNVELLTRDFHGGARVRSLVARRPRFLARIRCLAVPVAVAAAAYRGSNLYVVGRRSALARQHASGPPPR